MKTLTVEEMVERLATRGLMPSDHNLTIWQCADGEPWGAAITWHNGEKTAYGSSMREALEGLMQATNRAADLTETICLRGEK